MKQLHHPTAGSRLPVLADHRLVQRLLHRIQTDEQLRLSRQLTAHWPAEREFRSQNFAVLRHGCRQTRRENLSFREQFRGMKEHLGQHMHDPGPLLAG